MAGLGDGLRGQWEEDNRSLSEYNWTLIGQFWTFLFPFWKLLLAAVAISLIGAGFELAWPMMIKHIIDGPWAAGDMDGVMRLTAVMLALIVGLFVTDVALMFIVTWMGQSAMLRMRNELFIHLQNMHTQYFDRTPVGSLLTRVMNDVAVLNEALSVGIPTIFKDLIVLIGIVIVLLRTDAQLTLTVFVCFPLILVSGYLFSRGVRKYYRLTRLRLSALNAYLQENLSGMRIVQLFNRERRSLEGFSELNGRYRDANLGSVMSFALFMPAIEVVSGLGVALILWNGGSRMIGLSDGAAITGGTMLAFVLYLRRFFLPIRDLAEQVNVFQAALAAAERIFSLLEKKPLIVDPPAAVPLEPFRDKVEFRNVWFAYSEEDWVLRDVSFTVEKGQTIALVGATGAGKTSIINLLTRMYDAQKGDILIDGVCVREAAQRDLRRKMAIVLQDVFLFQGSIADNIRLGSPELNDEDVRRVARVVNADHFISRLPNGYASHIQERGATLSTGQKQLLAFARALACDPEILILDEATSNIDTETEHLIQEALARMLQGRTAIVIAHRLSTIKRADKILVLHHGKLREQGTHEELLALGGIYARLSQLQYEERTLA